MANFQLVFFFSSTLLVALSPTVITAALEQDLADLDSFIQSLMECESKPIVGLTISLVKNGDVVFCKGYGKRDLNQGLPLDNRTIFGLGSISKSFTATLLASVLAERDGVTLDTPLVDILGHDFRFQDEFLTKKTTLRDVLAHRTGLQRFPTKLLQFGMDIDRAELTRRVRHFSQVHPFRSVFYYNNLLYTLAGHVAERLAGKPLNSCYGKRSSSLWGRRPFNVGPSYLTYSRDGHALLVDREETFRIQKLHAPSGGMASNAADMARYMQLHLSGGKGPDGRTLVPDELFRESHTVQFFRPYQPDKELYRPQYPVGVRNNGEGFGLIVGDYRGYRRLFRSGIYTGFSSLMSLFPDASGGVFTSLNGPAFPSHVYIDVHSILHYRVADMLLGLEPWLNTTTACSFPQPWATYDVNMTMPPAPSRDFPRDKRDYEGTFGNPLFGNLTIRLNSTDGTLRFKVGLVGHGILLPISPGNRVLINGPPSQSAPVVANFEETQGGAINRLVIPVASPEPPVVFVRGLKLTDVDELPTEEGCAVSGAEATVYKMWSYCVQLGVAILVFTFI
ncbi:protein flp-like [Branchiostoma floridae]|uniref:Protein flp-like n=1 Tax=Branchiostoma floridae TaxID=7739 RepID=A0A9J7LPT3_BRAFL|nr:protein flp-like [Branchiostoma floridae]